MNDFSKEVNNDNKDYNNDDIDDDKYLIIFVLSLIILHACEEFSSSCT